MFANGPLIVELAALLHDIADWKSHGGDTTIGPRMAREWLVEIIEDNKPHVTLRLE